MSTGREALDHAVKVWRSSPRDCQFMFDFDGVLSPIQDDPASSVPAPGIIDVLHRIADVAGGLAVISARPVDFLTNALHGLHGAEFFGSYGLQHRDRASRRRDHPDLQHYQSDIDRALNAARERFPGLVVEDKQIAVAVHYRTSPDAQADVEQWARSIAETSQLVVQPGRMVVELKTPIKQNKGSAVSQLCDGMRSGWYFGDDVGDVPAFKAVHEKARTDPDFAGVGVGLLNDEPVMTVVDNTDLQLASPAELCDFLQNLADEHVS